LAKIPEFIYIFVQEISIATVQLLVPSVVIVILPMVCHALLIVEKISICANVITDAKPNTIVKNKRIAFFIDGLFHQVLCTLNMAMFVKNKSVYTQHIIIILTNIKKSKFYGHYLLIFCLCPVFLLKNSMYLLFYKGICNHI